MGIQYAGQPELKRRAAEERTGQKVSIEMVNNISVPYADMADEFLKEIGPKLVQYIEDEEAKNTR